MFAHLLKPIWRRKFKNLLLSLEILLAFLVVFAVAAASARFYQLYHQPVGFDYVPVWAVDIQTANPDGVGNDAATYDQLRRGLQALPDVVGVAFATYSPYQSITWQGGYYLPDSGAATPGNTISVSDDFFAVMGMQLVRGRWFSSADEGAVERPVVVNRRFAQALFPGQDPIGRIIADDKPGAKERVLMRVVGMVEDFRNQGEYMAPTGFVIERFSPLASKHGASTVLLRVRPGTTRAFEATLNKQLKLIRNDWSYRISPLADLRTDMLRGTEIPLLVLSVIAAFLLLMVAFGLFGVLWQKTTQRVPELGLRRAVGATAADIYWQIVIEQVLVTSLAVAVGVLLLVQLPITGVFGENLGWPLFLVAATASAAIMALVSVLCALYPAWQASRLSPTQALQYE